jgi:hypothetical protein
MGARTGTRLFFGLMAVAALACVSGCTPPVAREAAPDTEKSAQQAEPAPSHETLKPLQANEPRERLNVGKFVLELWDEEGTKPRFICFKEGSKQIYKQFLADNEVLNPVCDDGSAAVRLSAKPTEYVILERRNANDTYDYLVWKVTNEIKQVKGLRAVPTQVSFSGKGRTARLVADVQDLMDDWGARSVCPEIRIVYRWTGRRFIYHTREMRRTEEARKDLSGLRASIRSEFSNYSGDSGSSFGAPPELADEVLSLYYAGDTAAAKRFLDRCWPRHRPGKRQFWSFLKSEAHKSKYWTAVSALHRGES